MRELLVVGLTDATRRRPGCCVIGCRNDPGRGGLSLGVGIGRVCRVHRRAPEIILLDLAATMTDLPAGSINTALNAVLVTATTYYQSLHTADPGTTGASEVTGGSYARQAITFAAASGGSKASNLATSFTGMPAESGGTPYLGLWTAATAGTYLWGGATTGLSGSIPAGATVDFASGAVTASFT